MRLPSASGWHDGSAPSIDDTSFGHLVQMTRDGLLPSGIPVFAF